MSVDDWIEIGIVVDEATGIAARVCIQHGQKYALPAIQLGVLKKDDGRFSPFLHPSVQWEHGKGVVTQLEKIGSIPAGLQRQISDLLKPHLVERRADAVRELLNYSLVESTEGPTTVTSMGCLSCS